jgi:pimeloyl-ACP methyl ester carboxylesterase
MLRDIDRDRRRFCGAAVTLAAAQLGMFGTAQAQPIQPSASTVPPIKPGTNASFPSIKQADTKLLNVGYAESGPRNGTPVVLLHGWPYDIHSYVDVAPLLAAKGYRVIVPYLRGYGSTRFLSADTVRNGQQSVVALDILQLMDALKIQRAIIGGFDWGSRTAAIMAALWPERCKGVVAVSGYLVTNLEANLEPLPPEGEYGWWYQYYFDTERGKKGYEKNRHDFNKLIWKIVSPKWNFDDATYDRTAASFNNPDHVVIVIHNYRWRQSLAKGEPQYDALEQKLFAGPAIGVPTITIASDFDGPAADGSMYAKKFTGKYAHRILKDIGHNVPQEAPQAFAQAIIDVDRSVVG